MSTILSAGQRTALDKKVQEARTVAETAAADALRALAVGDTHRPEFLTDTQNELRLALRAKARQLGDDIRTRDADLTLLVRDVAYEQWHKLLFARFLERNGLLMHPDFPGTPLSLEDCNELAEEVGEPDGWSLAARFASQILPGVFRLDDPAVRVRLSTEHRLRLERLLMEIPAEVFEAEDALGWVYQFWQTAEKKRVNVAGNKIGGADLSPVTQLFTENYMVRFLLENSLGAWWAARHPDSPLVAGWEYLRRLDDGTPAAGTFDEWPTTAAEVTVMDPCCGSGHFLVAMFGMLWRMRAEEEGLTPRKAQDAVLRDNLFGLELDPRCTQIATFNVALEAWKQGGYRALPTPQIACSGVPVRQTLDEWLDGVPEHLRDTMSRLHFQFRNADTLGSLIDPRPAEVSRNDGGLFGRNLQIDVTWDDVEPHLSAKFAREGAAGSVLGHATEDVVQATTLLSERYNLVATNVPFLLERRQSPTLRSYLLQHHSGADEDLATALLERSLGLLTPGGAIACVSPQSWLSLKSYRGIRERLLGSTVIAALARLGPLAFREIKGHVVQVALCLMVQAPPGPTSSIQVVDLVDTSDKDEKLLSEPLDTVHQLDQLSNEHARIHFLGADPEELTRLGDIASSTWGTKTGDDARFRRSHWELPRLDGYEHLQGSPSTS